MDVSLYEALIKTFEKWDRLLKILLKAEITLSDTCKLCAYYNYNCDGCIASEEGICRIPPLDNKSNTYVEFEGDFYSALDRAFKIVYWLKKKIGEVEIEIYEGFRRLWEER